MKKRQLVAVIRTQSRRHAMQCNALIHKEKKNKSNTPAQTLELNPAPPSGNIGTPLEGSRKGSTVSSRALKPGWRFGESTRC